VRLNSLPLQPCPLHGCCVAYRHSPSSLELGLQPGMAATPWLLRALALGSSGAPVGQPTQPVNQGTQCQPGEKGKIISAQENPPKPYCFDLRMKPSEPPSRRARLNLGFTSQKRIRFFMTVKSSCDPSNNVLALQDQRCWAMLKSCLRRHSSLDLLLGLPQAKCLERDRGQCPYALPRVELPPNSLVVGTI